MSPPLPVIPMVPENFGGAVEGPLMRLAAPISFWGGVDPIDGRVSDPRHPDHGHGIAGTILAIPATIGSSSSSAIMLELIRNGTAPAALVLGTIDAILALGSVVARELDLSPVPVFSADAGGIAALPARGRTGRIDARGLSFS